MYDGQIGEKLQVIPDFADNELQDSESALIEVLSELGIIEYEDFVDNAEKLVPCEFVVRTDDIHGVAALLRAAHKHILMLGALTSATNNFKVDENDSAQNNRARIKGLIGIQPKTLNTAPGDSIPYRTEEYDRPLKSNEVFINAETMTIVCGAGVTPTQINAALAEHFGPEYYVPIDLTTTDKAQIGAVAATNAQGPSRIQLWQIAESLTITDGKTLKKITDKNEIKKNTGMWGLNGGLVEVELKILVRPPYKFGIFVPLQEADTDNWNEKLGALLTALGPATKINILNNEVKSGWEKGFVNGIEEFSAEALESILKSDSDAFKGDARRFLEMLQAAGSSKGLYLTGNSELKSIDEMLEDEESPLSVLCKLTEKEVTGDPFPIIADSSMLERMRLIRESFPDIARQEAKKKNFKQGAVFSVSTDINAHLDPEWVKSAEPEDLQIAFKILLQPYVQFENDIRKLAATAESKGIEVTLSLYGHFNPVNINPHRRVTVKDTPDAAPGAFDEVCKMVTNIREKLLANLLELPKTNAHIIIEEGEKGKIPKEALALMSDSTRAEVLELIDNGPREFQMHLPAYLRRLRKKTMHA